MYTYKVVLLQNIPHLS